MKLNKIYSTILFLLLFLFSGGMHAQLIDSKIEELADNVTNNFTYYLGTSNYKENQIKKIYFTYYKDLTNLQLGKSYLHDLKMIENTKEKELKKLLDDNEYSVYLKLKEVKKRGNFDYYEEIINSIPTENKLLEELVAYYSSTVFPVLSSFKLDFENQLSKADKTIFEKSSHEFGDNLDSLLTNNIELTQTSLLCLENSINSIQAIFKKYETNYNKIISQIIEANKYWQKEVTRIFLNHNYSREQIKTLSTPQTIIAQYGLNNLIEQLKFSQIEPFNERKYLVDITKFRNFQKELILFLEK